MDYYLSGMNGLDFFRAIKDNNKFTIKILTTAYADEKLIHAAKKAGINDIIQKPFSAGKLVLTILSHFEKEICL